MEQKNCAFQFVVTTGRFFKDIEIVEDKRGLTLSEAKELWNKYYPEAKKHIKSGDSIDMAIWINMTDEYSFGEKLHHIGSDAELDGNYIVERSVKYFPQTLK